MAIPFVVRSVLGAVVFFGADDNPGLWPMYLTVAAGLNMARGFNVPL